MSQAKLKVKLLEYTPNPEKLVAMAAKLCYSPTTIDELSEKLDEQSIEKFINMLLSMKHESPVEHVSFTFAIEGVSRITEQQLTRHRIGVAYSIQSGRYVKRDNLEYIIPPEIEKYKYLQQEYIEDMRYLQDKYNYYVEQLLLNYSYEYLVEELKIYDPDIQQDTKLILKIMKECYSEKLKEFNKKAIEDARYIYPQGLSTKIIVTMNLRELLHFLNKRCCNRSQWEIRDMADEMLRQCKDISPILFKRAGASCTYGQCPEGKMSCGKVRR